MYKTQQPKRLVGCDLINVAAQNQALFVETCERQYHDRIEQTADAALRAQRKLVMLTGPSGTGKTTSANKLAEAIAKRGVRSAVVSLDDFFVGAGRYPKQPDGSDDYECVEALDLPVLRHCLQQLCEQGSCDMPIFDFLTQRPRSETRHVDCHDGVVIVEGLHAFNPALTSHLPSDVILNVYASLREEYTGPDGRRLLATRDVRLARRMTRDWLFRGHDADFTFNIWPHVCDSEDRYIKTFKNRAHLVLDTSFSYEVCLWEHTLQRVSAQKSVAALQKLRDLYAALTPMPEQCVPTDSMLREFIGVANLAAEN